MSEPLPHDDAVDAFENRASGTEGVERLVLFGSVARSAHHDGSDIDVLAIISDGVDTFATEERLRDVAYEVMLEYGTLFSIHGVSESTYEERRNHPFFERVAEEGRALHG